MREIPLYQIDAFTKQPFRGNSAAVALLHPEHLPLTDENRQLMAVENNLAETAFVELIDPQTTFSTATEFNLRWFTPAVEGHGNQQMMLTDLGNSAPEITFNTRSGPLKVLRGPTGVGAPADARTTLVMCLPLIEANDQLPAACSHKDCALIKALCPGLQAWLRICASRPTPTLLERSLLLCDTEKSSIVVTERIQGASLRMQVQEVLFAGQLKYVLVVCNNTRQELEDLQPAIGEAEACSKDGGIVGVIVSLMCGDTICSRFFAPWAGIPEDPVTGSAHSVLAAYYCVGTGQQSMPARQCSKRGGDLQVALNAERQTVDVSGHTVTTIAGTMFVP